MVPAMSLRHLAVAFGFLTRLPVPDVSPVDDDDLRLATTWFPVVGFVVGALAGLARWSLQAPLGATAASVAAVAVGIAATGAFHEDGWADTFDGLWGGWTVERRIEIMRDSRIGVYGASALLLAVLLQVSLLAALPPWRAGLVLVAAHALGRAAILVQIRNLPAVSDQGSGATVAAPIPGGWLAVSLGITWIVTFVALGVADLWAIVAAGAATWTIGAIARRRIGGATGDVLGATVVAVMLAVQATAVALTRLGAW